MQNTQTKYTKGDWRVEGQFDAEVSVQIIAKHPQHGDLEIVEIEPLLGDWSEEEIANVRLMAAAPAMLKTLKQIVSDTENPVGILVPIRMIAKDAIAKAAGARA